MQKLQAIRLGISLLSVCFLFGQAKALDSVEFLSGAKMSGTVKEIRKAAKEFDFQATIAGRTAVRTFPFSKVHAVTLKGKRFVLTPKSDNNSSNEPVAKQRTESEVQQLIATEGAKMPDWFEKTKLHHPETLDLSWPLKPPTKGWKNKVNVGQYIWDIINPNPSRWKSGIKLVHHCQTIHQDNPALWQRDCSKLGTMFFKLFQDYPRAAYWYQKANVSNKQQPGVRLAECYWRLGNKAMAMKHLPTRSADGGALVATIKLLGEMGSTQRALQMTNRLSKTGIANEAFLVAGDVMRRDGQLEQAIQFYERVVNGNSFRNKEYENRYKARARESIESIHLFDQADPAKVPDGTHPGSSTGYNGKLEIAVTVAGGKIQAVKVTRHKEKQFYSALTDTEANIIRVQGVSGVDGTSGATITSQAIVNATAKALAGASN